MDIRSIIRPLLKIEHHMNLIYPTSLVLKNDGKGDIYRLLTKPMEGEGKTGIELLEQGTRDADVPFSGGYIWHMWHFHHPWIHRGYLSSKSSADVLAELFFKALALWQTGSKAEALYQLGRSLHLIQDIFVPHHAGITAFRGHGDLEEWLLQNWEPYKVDSGGYYEWKEFFYNNGKRIRHRVSSDNPYDWIDHGSHISIDWYNKHFRRCRYDRDSFPKIAPFIVSHVMRFSAGFINRFISEAGG